MPRNATVVKLGQDNDPLATAPEKNVKTTLDARIRITGSPHGNGIIRGLRCYPYGGRPEEYRSVVPHYKCPRARPPRVMTINLESARYARSTCWQGPFLVRVVARASENPYSLKPASASDEEEKGYVQQPSLIMATETAAASTTSLQVTNDDARGTLIVSASTGATPNGTADVEQLRWVGSQFIYFLDIPCVEIYAYPSSPSTSSDEPNETESDDPSETESDEPSGTDSSDSSSRPCIRSAEFVRTLIEGVMDMEVSMDHLERRDEAERKIISGDNLARLLVPWARGLLLEREHLALDPVHLEHGRRAKSVLLREIQAFDDAAQQWPLQIFERVGRMPLPDIGGEH
ncbi:hypothetical protein BD310DRAFT_909948 [Dichomitus squalens]|uniref:Uncharacterized protein n=1 Tax=Dichomitus squalens TaxID=114155 RepID=A0A4Q9PD35_9APHY|nr:hypothetical protein BD310DRAFT_909948 [Dichomitus squalens]